MQTEATAPPNPLHSLPEVEIIRRETARGFSPDVSVYRLLTGNGGALAEVHLNSVPTAVVFVLAPCADGIFHKVPSGALGDDQRGRSLSYVGAGIAVQGAGNYCDLSPGGPGTHYENSRDVCPCNIMDIAHFYCCVRTGTCDCQNTGGSETVGSETVYCRGATVAIVDFTTCLL